MHADHSQSILCGVLGMHYQDVTPFSLQNTTLVVQCTRAIPRGQLQYRETRDFSCISRCGNECSCMLQFFPSATKPSIFYSLNMKFAFPNPFLLLRKHQQFWKYWQLSKIKVTLSEKKKYGILFRMMLRARPGTSMLHRLFVDNFSPYQAVWGINNGDLQDL